MADSSPKKDTYFTYTIDGSQLMLDPIRNSPNGYINIENLDDESSTCSPDPLALDSQNHQEYVVSELIEPESNQTIPLMDINGKLYIFRDGQLEEITIAAQNSEVEEDEQLSNIIQVFGNNEQNLAEENEHIHPETNEINCEIIDENSQEKYYVDEVIYSQKCYIYGNIFDTSEFSSSTSMTSSSMNSSTAPPTTSTSINSITSSSIISSDENGRNNMNYNEDEEIMSSSTPFAVSSTSINSMTSSSIITTENSDRNTGDDMILYEDQLGEIEQLDSDVLEVVTAFKCKICSYTSQDRSELLQHFKEHTTPQNDSAEGDVKLMYMCGECSECFTSMELCKEHMIEDHQLRAANQVTTSPSEDPSNTEEDSFESKSSGTTLDESCEEENEEELEEEEEEEEEEEDEEVEKEVDEEAEKDKEDNAKKMAKGIKRRKAYYRDRNVRCRHKGCVHRFTSDEMRQKHEDCHTDCAKSFTTFKCPHCPDAKFPKWRLCNTHLWKEHEIAIDLYSCTVCNTYKAPTLTKLTSHMRVHSDAREYKCNVCGKKFKQSGQLRNHRVIHMDRESSNVQRWYTSRTCEICNKTYADAKCLRNHMQAVHSKIKPYVCNICGHASARKAMLQLHRRQHTGDKPFACDTCDYRTGDHNSLRKHQMRHTGVRPYKCPHCPYSAIQSNCYKNHLKTKHPESSLLFICQLCPFKTVKQETYTVHLANHEKGLIKTASQNKEKEQEKEQENAEEIEQEKEENENEITDDVGVFHGNIAAAQLIYSCLGTFAKEGEAIEANLMTSATSADGSSQTITIQIPSKHLEGSLPMGESANLPSSIVEQPEDDDDEDILHCFLKLPRDEEENIDTGGITIPAEPDEETEIVNVDS